ncbi:MAG: hypothetical protein AB1650_08720 [Candidatus Omnitrophota bacterium]
MMDREKSTGCIFSLASWGAIFAGVVIILVGELMLSLLGMAFGLWIIDPAQGTPMGALSTGAAIWWVVSSIIAVFLGGWLSGRMAAGALTTNAMLHGVVTWGVATLFSVYLFTAGVGALTSGAMSLITGSLQAVGTSISGTVSSIVEGGNLGAIIPPEIQKEVDDLLRPGTQGAREGAGQQTPMVSPEEARRTIMEILQKGPRSINRQDRETLTDMFVQLRGMTRQEASSTVNRMISRMEQLQQRVSQATERAQKMAGQTAQGLGTAAFWSFIMLLLTLVAAAFGGAIGGKSRT